MKLKIENTAKSRQKAIKISYMCDCKYVCIYMGEDVCVRVRVDACF